jgi:hypothetical protein
MIQDKPPRVPHLPAGCQNLPSGVTADTIVWCATCGQDQRVSDVGPTGFSRCCGANLAIRKPATVRMPNDVA